MAIAEAPARRNIGILAHIDAGKTTLTEQLLFHTGVIGRLGSVEDGSTVADWALQEQERGITIGSAAVSCHLGETEITIVDTPGHVDFTVEVERCLTVLDGALLVLSGPDGVEAQTQTVWHQAARRRLPVLGFVNKLDRPGFDDDALQAQIRARLGIEPLPLQIPVAYGSDDVALIDLLRGELLRWSGARHRQAARAPEVGHLDEEQEILCLLGRERLVDAVASYDDAFAGRILSGETPEPRAYLEAIASAARARACIPLVYGVARAGIGIGAAARGVVDLLPSPELAPAPPLYELNGRVQAEPAGEDGRGETAAFVFKTEARQRGRRLSWVRVFSGTLRRDSELLRLPSGAPHRLGELVRIMGGSEEPVDALGAGEIGGLVHDPEVQAPLTGETLATSGFGRMFEPLRVPSPVIAVVLEAADLEMDRVLRRRLGAAAVDDPSLEVATDPDTGLVLVAGMGELHLELLVERLRREGLHVTVGQPRARHRDVPTRPGRGRASVDALTTAGSRVAIEVEVRPERRSTTRAIAIEIAAPRRQDWREAIEAGVEAGLGGPSSSVDMIGVLAAVVEIEVHGSDPAPQPFFEAARAATEAAVQAAAPVRAEPWGALAVIVPEASVGPVSGDLARRRARITGSETRGRSQVLSVEVPLADTIAYATGLRSLTSGRGVFTLEPTGYEPI